MRLYTTASGRWVATQKDAGKGGQRRDVPTTQAELLVFLNAHRVGAAPADAVIITGKPVELMPPPRRDLSAEACLSRMDNPGTDVDAIIAAIAASKGYFLRRCSAAVASAFQRLAGDVK